MEFLYSSSIEYNRTAIKLKLYTKSNEPIESTAKYFRKFD